MKTDTFFVVSAYKNPVDWIFEYVDTNYIIYDKSHDLNPYNYKTIQPENVGYNIYDVLSYIVDNYDNLPEYVAFLQGLVWDHCKKETFDKLIYKKEFVSIEDYSHVPESSAHKKDIDGSYMEINTSWYLYTSGLTHRFYKSYDLFMKDVFSNYEHLDWIRFCPGAQYIVPKQNILYYSKSFYQKLTPLVSYSQLPSEAHLLERAMYYIFTNAYEEKQ